LALRNFSLNVEKSNFVVFYPPQRKLPFNLELTLNNIPLQQEKCIRYLSIFIDSNLSWKPQVDNIARKIKRSVGVLSKLRYYVNINILTNIYYALIYPYLIYGITVWGNTYLTTLQPLFVLQKKSMRIMTFSKFDDHTSPIFKSLKVIKLCDLVTLHIAVFMFKFHNQMLPSAFSSFSLLPLKQSIIIMHDQLQTNLIIFPKQGQIMVNLTLGFKGLKSGTRLV
jgi:hypothetical protein